MNRPIPLWAALAGADRFSSAARDRLSEWAVGSARNDGSRAAIVTCHRVELYGIGDDGISAVGGLPRDRGLTGLVEAFSERLVAGLLHEPSAALRDDLDGTAATAARQLFRL